MLAIQTRAGTPVLYDLRSLAAHTRLAFPTAKFAMVMQVAGVVGFAINRPDESWIEYRGYDALQSSGRIMIPYPR